MIKDSIDDNFQIDPAKEKLPKRKSLKYIWVSVLGSWKIPNNFNDMKSKLRPILSYQAPGR
jgi:hypothetical protein